MSISSAAERIADLFQAPDSWEIESIIEDVIQDAYEERTRKASEVVETILDRAERERLLTAEDWQLADHLRRKWQAILTACLADD